MNIAMRPALAGGYEKTVVLPGALLGQLLGGATELLPGHRLGLRVDASLLQVLDVVVQQRVVLLVRDERERVRLAVEDVVAVDEDAARVTRFPLGEIRDDVVQRLAQPCWTACAPVKPVGSSKTSGALPFWIPSGTDLAELRQRQAVVGDGDVWVGLLIGREVIP